MGSQALLTWLSHHDYMMMLAILVMSIGGTLVFVGNLFAIVYAFGQSVWWGIGVLIMPLFSVVYCARNWDRAAYPGKMIFAGLAIIGLFYLFLSIMAMTEAT